MLEALVGVVAGLLFVTGLLIMVWPSLGRSLGFAGRRTLRVRRASHPGSQPAEPHPTVVRVLASADRLCDLLSAHGMGRHASALRHASRRLQVSEADGIYAMQEVLKRLRRLRLGDESDQEIYEGLLNQVRRALNDRAEQLELLPRG